jgi:hypothetical protein
MADIAEIKEKIKAVEFALGTFADYENEEERRKFLRQNFTAVPGLKTYFGFSEDKLQDEKKQLQDEKKQLQDALNRLQEKEKELQREKNLLLEKENLLLAQQQGSGGSQTAVFAPLQSSEYDGIQDMSTALPRLHLVADLFNKITLGSSRFIHLGAPAASGKTSLLQLFQRFCGERGVICIYVSMLLGDFKAVLSKKTGINASTWMLEHDVNGHCVCADSSKKFVVMLDDAQHQYGNVGLWTSLIKPDMDSSLPDNIRFIISATYSLGTDVSPVDFRTLPKLVHGDFRLSQEEVDEFIRLSSVRMGAERAGGLLIDPVVRNVIATNCNGHIGALSVSVREIVKRFHHNTGVSV